MKAFGTVETPDNTGGGDHLTRQSNLRCLMRRADVLGRYAVVVTCAAYVAVNTGM